MSQSKDILIQAFPFLTSADADLLLIDSKLLTFNHRDTISKEGDTITDLYFIVSGMVRGYFTTENGDERTIIIRPTHSFCAAPEVLKGEQKSKYAFEAIQSTILIKLSISRFFALAQTHLSISRLYVAILEENLKTVFFRVELLAGMSPEERYTRLIEDRPELFQKSYHKYVANYLGITPNSLSRIIKRKKER